MKQRVITGVVAAAIFLPIVYAGGFPFILLTYVLATVGLYELFKMRKLSIYSIPGLLSILMLCTLLFPPQYGKIIATFPYSKTEIGIAVVLLLLTYTVITKNLFTF